MKDTTYEILFADGTREEVEAAFHHFDRSAVHFMKSNGDFVRSISWNEVRAVTYNKKIDEENQTGEMKVLQNPDNMPKSRGGNMKDEDFFNDDV